MSLAAVEALAGELWPTHLTTVASAPDERKGERLIMLTDAPQATLTAVVASAKLEGAVDRTIPAEVCIGAVPALGSGKVDFVTAKRLLTDPGTASKDA